MSSTNGNLKQYHAIQNILIKTGGSYQEIRRFPSQSKYRRRPGSAQDVSMGTKVNSFSENFPVYSPSYGR